MNLANAQLITGASGWQQGNNVGQVGDLSNWFKWVPPAAGNYYFTTRFSRPADVSTNFKTTLNAATLSASPHNPVIIGDLTFIVNYLPASAFPTGVGYEIGSYIAFAVTDPTLTYYIEVGSFDGVSTGIFDLSWGPFVSERLGACGGCTSAASGLCKVGESNITDLFGPAIYPFGNFPSGYYYAVLCGSAWGTRGAAPPGSPVNWSILGPPLFPNNFFNLNYFSAGLAATINLIGPPFLGDFNDLLEADTLTRSQSLCINYAMAHSGGFISLSTSGTFDAGLVNGVSNGAFALMLFDLTKQLTIALNAITNNGFANGVDFSAGYAYSGSLKIQNTSLAYASGPLFIEFIAADGGSTLLPVGPQPIASITNLGNSIFNLSFKSTALDKITGQFRISDCAGTVVETITVTLATATCAVNQPFVHPCTHAGDLLTPLHTSTLGIQNVGVIPISGLIITIAATPGIVKYSNPNLHTNAGAVCTDSFLFTNWTLPVGRIEPNDPFGIGRVFAFFALERADANQPTNVTLTISATLPDGVTKVMPDNAQAIVLN